MKKILLIAGVISFSFAYSQNNDSFDVEKYLMKKSEKEKNPEFKKAPLKFHFTPRGKTGNADSYRFPDTFQSNPPGKLSHVLPNGDKVYSLPQDHMPCVVPDMSQYKNMPAVKPNIPHYNIPNPYYPQNNIGSFTPEKLKALQELLNKKPQSNN